MTMAVSPRHPLIEEVDPPESAPAVFELFADEPFSYFLDSGMDPGKLGRFSFMGSSPFLVLKTWADKISIAAPSGTIRSRGDPFDVLRSLLETYAIDRGALPVPFVGGAVGFLSYDLGRSIESLPVRATDDLLLPECCLGFYDRGLVFDHITGKAYVVSTGFPEQGEEARLARARRRLEELKALLLGFRSTPPRGAVEAREDKPRGAAVQSNFSRDGYLAAVARAREYIIEGDIFEVNLSQRFEADVGVGAYELYRRLRCLNPAPFASYLGFDEVQVVGASPERFLRKTGDMVETRPIKGTRPRGKTPDDDKRLAAELLSSAKDRAENTMIVDLERNDLGRVCRYGSVRVKELAILETYPTVFHLTSTVEGRLREGVDTVDLLRATFPGGSITGAPKIRAMEIIEELEPNRRSVYSGSIGYFGFDGDIDLNIVIRTFLVKGGRVYFQVGGAVVYDSVPSEEYRETLDKAQALFAALSAEGDLSTPSAWFDPLRFATRVSNSP
jgi:para-aminobenzoate synthetase component 1